MRGIKLTFREPAQHARLPDPRVPEDDEPEEDVVLLGHDGRDTEDTEETTASDGT